ncbi:MAG: hypothetical protein QNJ68_21290, partial [Microcoleaceae cyanobacterium MO_207.B10]|nr:hypothetical protein [Microcoleaceae cyanobacterium MO_207.B10]
ELFIFNLSPSYWLLLASKYENLLLKFQKIYSHKMAETVAYSPHLYVSASGVSPCPTPTNQFLSADPN